MLLLLRSASRWLLAAAMMTTRRAGRRAWRRRKATEALRRSISSRGRRSTRTSTIGSPPTALLYPGAFEGDLEDTKASFPIYVDLFDEFRERVGELDTPSSLQALVDDAIAADEVISAIHHQRAELLADATSYSDVDTIFADSSRVHHCLPADGVHVRRVPGKGIEHGIAFERECGS